MTPRTIRSAALEGRSARPASRAALLLAALALPLAALLLASAPVRAADAAPGEMADDLAPRSLADLARSWAAAPRGPAGPGRGASPLAGGVVTANDTFIVLSHGFEDLAGNCEERGWLGQDLTARIFAHVSSRFTVDDGYVTIGTRSLWFGADSSSAPDEVASWVQAPGAPAPYGYGNGWSQRLTSPAFSRGANPGAVLRFHASIELRRNIDTAPTNAFTPYGLASGKVANDFIGVQARRADGTWVFLNGRFSFAKGPPWEGTAPLFVNRVGGVGVSPTTMSAPNGIAVDDSGNVYVADRGNDRILKYTGSGRFLLAFGTSGLGPGQLSSPFDIEVDAAGNVYVVDAGHRVQKFTNAGAFLAQWGTFGAGPGQFNTPGGIARDPAGNLYVSDTGNHRIQRFTPAGAFLVQWGTFGAGPGQFNGPSGIAVDAAGFLYVADTGNHRVQRFFPFGAFAGEWGTLGAGDGQFNSPSGVAVDPQGHVWVADRGNHRIQRFTAGGAFLLRTGTFSPAGGHYFDTPRDVAIGRAGDLYVIESGNARFQWFTLGGPISGEGLFRYEVRLEEDGNQDLGLADSIEVRVVMQSSPRISSQDGMLFPGQTGVILVDNLTLRDSTGADVVAPADFEDGTSGPWALSAFNAGHTANFNLASTTRDFPLPMTGVGLRSGFDPLDPSCVWTFLSAGDSLPSGVYARLASPWIPLVPGQPHYAIAATTRLNALGQGRFLFVYTRGKNAGDVRPRAYNSPSFVYFGAFGFDESAVPLDHSDILRVPENIGSGAVFTDSIQIVFEVLDQYERTLGLAPEARPRARLPILDNVEVKQIGVDADFDGVADAFDACPSVCAAGEDADADGCVDSTATLHHVESWRAGTPLRYVLTLNAHPGITDGSDMAAVDSAFAAWRNVPGAALSVARAPALSPPVFASPFDGVNLITFEDTDFEFSPDVLAVTPTASFTRRVAFGDRMVLPGEIVDSDMIFNPSASFRTPGHAGTYDLRSVATHEAGHFLGLSHTGVRDATMFFVNQPGEDGASLENDDRGALAAAYRGPTLLTDFGSIRGRVIRDTTSAPERPVRGALVTAVLLDGGGAPLDTVASDYTREDGSYALYRLPPGTYGVHVAALDGTILSGLNAAFISVRLFGIVETDFEPEWWSDGDSPFDDPALMTPIALGAGGFLTDVNIFTNLDTIPPTVTGVNPPATQEGVPIDASIQVSFSEPVSFPSLQTAIKVRKFGETGRLGGNLLLASHGRSMLFSPSLPLEFGAGYEIVLTTALTDLSGVPLASEFVSDFSTESRPPVAITNVQPRSGPRGALLTISGQGFDPSLTNRVIFRYPGGGMDSSAVGTFVTPTSMVAQIPALAPLGEDTVSVQVGEDPESNRFVITVLPPAPQASPVPSGSPIPLGFAPTDAALSAAGSMAYAVGEGGFATVNLDPALTGPTTPLRAAQPRFTDVAKAIALAPDGTRAFITQPLRGQVLVVNASPGDANLGVVLDTIPVPGAPDGIAVSPAGRRAYATDQLAGLVYELDVNPSSLTPNTLIRMYPVPGAILTGGIAVDPRGDRLYLTSTLGGLSLTLADSSIVVETATPSEGGVAADLAGTLRFFTALTNGLAFRGGLRGAGSVFLGGSAADVIVTPQGQSALVANKVLNRLQVVDIVPGNPGYLTVVASVPTGASPRAVAADAGGGLLAVANYAGQSLSLYQLLGSGAPGVARVFADVASPGDQVGVQAVDPDDFAIGTRVDLGFTEIATSRALGRAAAFVVPPSAQRATSLTMVRPDSVRSLSMPFRVVDRIESFVPRITQLSLPVPGVPGFNCPGPVTTGDVTIARTRPDGRLLALGSESPCGLFLDLYRATDDGPEPLGTHLTRVPGRATGQILAGSGEDIDDMAFTPDGRRLWVVTSALGILEVDVDPDSPTLGQVLASFGSLEVDNPRAVLADPLGRYMILGSGGTGTLGLSFWDPETRGVIFDIPALDPFSLAASADGRYLVGGGRGIAHIVDLDTFSPLASPVPPTGASTDSIYYSVGVSADGKRAVGFYGRLIGGPDATRVAVWNLDPGAGAVGAQLYFGTVPGPAGVVLDHLIPAPDGDGLIAACANCDSLVKIEPSVIPPAFTYAPIPLRSPVVTRSTDGRRLWGAQRFRFIGGPVPVDSWFARMLNLAPATGLALVAGGDQSAPAGTTLPVPIRARVTGAGGSPQAGVVVEFALGDSTQGSVGSLTALRLTDTNGEAEASWTLPLTGAAVSMSVTALGTTAAPFGVNAAVAVNDSAIAPVVIQLGPPDGAANLNVGTPVFALFNQRMSPATGSNLLLFANGTPVAGSHSLQQDGRLVLFQPSLPLAFSARCSLVLTPGAEDQEGQTLAAGGTSVFTIQPPPSVAIASITPPSGPAGASVVISGSGFSPVPAQNAVRFNGTPAPVLSATTTSLTLNVPLGATSGGVTVQVGVSTSPPFAFNVLQPSTDPGTVVGDLAASQGIRDVAYTPDGARAYVTNPGTNSVTALDVENVATIASVTVGLKPQAVTILPSPLRAYVANTNSNDVSVIDVDPASQSYNQVVNKIPVGAGPTDIIVSGVGPRIFVLNGGAGTLSAIDANPGNATFDQVVNSTNCGAGGQGVAISADGTRAFVAGTFGFSVVNLVTNQIVTTTNTGAGGAAIAIKPDGTLAFVLGSNGVLFVLDLTAGPNQYKVVTSTNCGAGAQGVSISADGALAYVTGGDGNVLLVYQIASGVSPSTTSIAPGPGVTLTLRATIPVGQSPTGLAVDPTGRPRTLVANSGSGTVTVVGFATSLPRATIEFDFNPNTLNLRSMGKWVTGYLEPPAPDFTPEEIVLSSIRLNGSVAVDSTGPHEIGDHDGDGRPDLMVKFPRLAVQLLLPEGERVPVTVTGAIGTRLFLGTDSVRVIPPPVVAPLAGAVLGGGSPFVVRWEVPRNTQTQWVALLHSFDRGNSWQLDATQLPNSGQYLWAVPDVHLDSARVAVVLVESSDSTGTLVEGLLGLSGPFSILRTTDVEATGLPAALSFTPFQPNPARGVARLRFGLPRRADVRLEVFDVQGRLVHTLARGTLEPGWHTREWRGETAGGDRVAPGLFFVRFRADGRDFNQRFVWLR